MPDDATNPAPETEQVPAAQSSESVPTQEAATDGASPVESGNQQAPETGATGEAKTKPDPESARKEFFDKWSPDDTKKPVEADPEEAPEEEPPAAPAAKPAQPDDLTPLTNETASKLPPGEARRKINRLITRIKEQEARSRDSEDLAQLGTDVLVTARNAGWTPQEYVATMQTIVAARQGNAEAASRLAGMLGVAPAVAKPAWGMEDEAWLTDAVASGDMTAEAAKQLRQRMLQAKAPVAPATQATVPPPAPAARPQPQQAPPARLDITGQVADALDRATAGLSEGDVAKVDAEVKKELAVYRQRHPNLSREAYPAVIEAIATGVVQRHKSARQPPQIRSGLRPNSQHTQPTTVKTSPKDQFFSKW